MVNPARGKTEEGVVSAEHCSLSQSLQRLVLESPIRNSDEATSTPWGALALENMVVILRQRGYQVKEPARFTAGEQAEGIQSAQTSHQEWAEDGPSPADSYMLPPDLLARFHILTAIMDDNRGEDGRVNAQVLEEKLLEQDGHAFEKEGVEQLKQYLMKAREGGIPIKFDGDRHGLSQVWFKGHKDLETALARYHMHGSTKSPPSANPGGTSDWSWRSPRQYNHHHHQPNHHSSPQRPYHHYHHYQDGQPGSLSNNMPNRYRTPSERAFDSDFLLDILRASGADYQQGVEANRVEQALLDVVQGLYEIKPGVKRFKHYLMNMRAAGAPIWFSRDEEGRPKEIFIKNVSNTPSSHHPGGVDYGSSSRMRSNPASQLDRFASLIHAYQFHFQPNGDMADGQLVQSRLEKIDPTIYTREQCSTFKQLLKLARLSGLDINWEQTELGVTSIRVRSGGRGDH